MNIILGSVDRMNDIISTLLDVSRIDAGKLGIEYSLVDVGALVNTIVQELSVHAKNKKVNLSFLAPATPLTAVTDPLLLAEAYANLVSNAIKYTPALGKISVTLEASKDGLSLSVKDSGLGIPIKLQDQVFSKFFRGSNVVKWDTSGTGLGLYVVKQIADALEGKTWFTSREGRGSSFYFKIPTTPSTRQ